MTPAGPDDIDAALFTPSPVVTNVYEELLEAVHRGDLLPGERISDGELAKRYGVSRSPVREALQRLRDIGIIEASASRFTRVAVVTPVQTTQAYVVWLSLFATLVEEVIESVPVETVELMEHDMADFRAAFDPWQPERIATANFVFFSRLMALTNNPILLRSMTGVVHVIRLGSLHLPATIDLEKLAGAHQTLVDAAREHDLDKARVAVRALRTISIPLD